MSDSWAELLPQPRPGQSADDRVTQWWRDHAGRVQAYALRHVDPHTAQEVVAETFLIAWRRDSDVPGDVLPWLFAVARNVIRNQRRSTRRSEALTQRLMHVTTHGDDDPPADVAVAVRDEMLRALAQLSESHREALLLVAWDGLGREQAAEVAGCRVGTFDVRLTRARKRLAELLADADHNPAPTRRARVVEPVRPGGTR